MSDIRSKAALRTSLRFSTLASSDHNMQCVHGFFSIGISHLWVYHFIGFETKIHREQNLSFWFYCFTTIPHTVARINKSVLHKRSIFANRMFKIKWRGREDGNCKWFTCMIQTYQYYFDLRHLFYYNLIQFHKDRS